MSANKSKTIQVLKPKDTQKPNMEHLDLTAPLFPSYEYFDENGKRVSCLRGEYELGDGGREVDYPSIEREGYRKFTKKVRWQSWLEITDYDLTPEEKELCELNKSLNRCDLTARKKTGHTTIYGHEFVPHTGVNALLTQNPVCKSKVDDGCGENKEKYSSPLHHPISFKDCYDYWDEKLYLKVFETGEKSPDTYEMMLQMIYFTCPKTEYKTSSDKIYINPHNNQVYALCPVCLKRTNKKHEQWHQITDPESLEAIAHEVGFELIKYKKLDTETSILSLVVKRPGINYYQISRELALTKGVVSRGVNRLKVKHLVRTRRVGKAICIYPIFDADQPKTTMLNGTRNVSSFFYMVKNHQKWVRMTNEIKKMETSDSSKNIDVSSEPDTNEEITESGLLELLDKHFNDIAQKCEQCGARITWDNPANAFGCDYCCSSWD